MSGLGGGGGFMLFHDGKTGQVHGLDYIGLPPAAADPSVFSSIDAISRDVRSSTVPGTLGGWLAALERFGTMDRAAVFKPAIELAEQRLADHRVRGQAALRVREGASASSPPPAGEYLPQGRPPRAGEIVPRPNLARTYREVVEGGAETFYRGDLGERIVQRHPGGRRLAHRGRLRRLRPEVGRAAGDRVSRQTLQTLPPPSLGLPVPGVPEDPGSVRPGRARAQLDRVPAPAAGDDQARQRRPHPLEPRGAPDHPGADLGRVRRRAPRPDRPPARPPSEGERYLPNKNGEVRAGRPVPLRPRPHHPLRGRGRPGQHRRDHPEPRGGVRERLRGRRHRPGAEQLPVLDRPRPRQPELHAAAQAARERDVALHRLRERRARSWGSGRPARSASSRRRSRCCSTSSTSG